MSNFTPCYSCTNCVNFSQNYIEPGGSVQGVVMLAEANDDHAIEFEVTSDDPSQVRISPDAVTVPKNGVQSTYFTLSTGVSFKHPSIVVQAKSRHPNLRLDGVLLVKTGE